MCYIHFSIRASHPSVSHSDRHKKECLIQKPHVWKLLSTHFSKMSSSLGHIQLTYISTHCTTSQMKRNISAGIKLTVRCTNETKEHLIQKGFLAQLPVEHQTLMCIQYSEAAPLYFNEFSEVWSREGEREKISRQRWHPFRSSEWRYVPFGRREAGYPRRIKDNKARKGRKTK